MDFDDLRREGEHPAIVPDAGLRRTLAWTRADCGRYGELLKQTFPNVLFFEDFGARARRPEKPTIRFVERLDEPDLWRNVEAVFPYPGWKPELTWQQSPYSPTLAFWHWSRYLSPIVTIGVSTYDRICTANWRGAPDPVRYFHACHITTSYRRQLPDEASIQAKAVRIAEGLCVRMPLAFWESYEAFRTRKGKLRVRGGLVDSLHATPAAIDLARREADGVVDLATSSQDWAHSYLPLDAIPDSWWDGIRRPKWAQAPR